MKDVFKDYKLIKRGKQPPNLECILCKLKLSSEPKKFDVKKYNKSCFCCEYILEGSQFKSKEVGKTFFLKFNFNCDNSYLNCVVICCGSQEKYIGQTGILLKESVSVYQHK